MPDSIDSQAFLKLCEMSIDNMYELEALGALLEQKGLITKQEIIDLVPSLKQKTPPAPVVEPIYFSALLHFQHHFRHLKMSLLRTEPLTAESHTHRSHYRLRSSHQGPSFTSFGNQRHRTTGPIGGGIGATRAKNSVRTTGHTPTTSYGHRKVGRSV